MDLDGRVQRRLSVASKWLHDCEWVADELYLFSLSDTNRLELWDVRENLNVWSLDLGPYGNSAQFSFVC
jgi:WD40 repeat protein